jgi:hypothetical protein
MESKIRMGTRCGICGEFISDPCDCIRVPSLHQSECFAHVHCAELYKFGGYSKRIDSLKTSYTGETRETKSAFKYAVEYEANFRMLSDIPEVNGFSFTSETEVSAFIACNYVFVPTSDITVDVEFKERPAYNFHGLETKLRNMDKYIDMTAENCGQHINISGNSPEWYSPESKTKLSNSMLWRPLVMTLRDNTEATKRLFGRTFSEYSEYSETEFKHGKWLNIRNESAELGTCLEFRIAKFQTPTQFFILVNMCRDFEAIADKVLKGHDVNQASIELVQTFLNYANGDSIVQKRIAKKK